MKKLLKIFLSKSRILKPFKSFNQNKLIIFNYHRIRDINKPSYFDDAIFGPNAFRFRQEMEWLKRETRIISESELYESIYNQKPINEICSMVTFDDGYRDNYDIAYPILKELNIPAMFFIPTYHLSERKVGWWDQVAFLIKNTNKKKFTFQNRDFVISNPALLTKQFNSEIKLIATNKVENYISDLSLALEQPSPNEELQHSELMTWEQIKIMNENGMSIGSHSHDHSILSQQDTKTLQLQLKKSIVILESVINEKIKSIAYPVGGYDHFNSETKDIAKAIGFKLGFSYLTGVNHWANIDPFDVKRMRLQPEWLNLDLPLAFPNHFLKNQFIHSTK